MLRKLNSCNQSGDDSILVNLLKFFHVDSYIIFYENLHESGKK